jgi:hypothetical protein
MNNVTYFRNCVTRVSIKDGPLWSRENEFTMKYIKKMTTTPNLEKQEVSAENQKAIENHKKTASLLDAASKEHLEAVKHFEAGNTEKAAESKVKADEQFTLATAAQKEIGKN